jgi:hypothetical protein
MHIARKGGGRLPRGNQTKPPKERSNRIFELTKQRNLTYAQVAEKVREVAENRGDAAHRKVHEITINRLAQGKSTLTQQWMNLLAEVFHVTPAEIIAAPPAQNLVRLRVSLRLEGGIWAENHEIPEAEQAEIMVPDDEALRGAHLYAAELRGPASNARWPEGTIAILSVLMQRPGEIAVDRRYHVRIIRPDGTSEETIKCLIKDDDGRYWLRSESTHPAFQTWLPLEGEAHLAVHLLGRVRRVYAGEPD